LPGRQVGKQWRFSCQALVRMFDEADARLPGDVDA